MRSERDLTEYEWMTVTRDALLSSPESREKLAEARRRDRDQAKAYGRFEVYSALLVYKFGSGSGYEQVAEDLAYLEPMQVASAVLCAADLEALEPHHR